LPLPLSRYSFLYQGANRRPRALLRTKPERPTQTQTQTRARTGPRADPERPTKARETVPDPKDPTQTQSDPERTQSARDGPRPRPRTKDRAPEHGPRAQYALLWTVYTFLDLWAVLVFFYPSRLSQGVSGRLRAIVDIFILTGARLCIMLVLSVGNECSHFGRIARGRVWDPIGRNGPTVGSQT
jgi:hypothetical protein